MTGTLTDKDEEMLGTAMTETETAAKAFAKVTATIPGMTLEDAAEAGFIAGSSHGIGQARRMLPDLIAEEMRRIVVSRVIGAARMDEVQ